MPVIQKSFRKGLIFVLSIVLVIMTITAATLFFKTHFYPGTVINGIKVSCQTAEEADCRLARKASSYILTLNERNNIREQIKGSEIGLEFGYPFVSSYYKKIQNRTFWIISLLQRNCLTFEEAFTYDEGLLNKKYEALICTDSSRTIKPKNAGLIYSNGAYRITKEIPGNQVIDEVLYEHIKLAIKNGSPELDLEQINCYHKPTIKWDSQKVLNTKIVAEGYVSSKVIYQFADGTTSVDGDNISVWINFDDNLNISFDKKKIAFFLNQLAVHYDTTGKERDFITSSGKRIKIGGGDYGWKVDIRKETENLIEIIMSGMTVVKEPEFSQRGALRDSNDIGTTYVEIDLTKQHLWFYISGILIVQGDVVTGNVRKGYKTPEGIYGLKYKIRNAVLKGENYETSVSYWMPFNHDIGVHDAPWRTRFGGDIYLTRGSHGCINAPLPVAEVMFKQITVGTPIICYY